MSVSRSYSSICSKYSPRLVEFFVVALVIACMLTMSIPVASAQSSLPPPVFQVTAQSKPLVFVARFNDCNYFNNFGNRECRNSSFGTDARNSDFPDHVSDLWVLLPNGSTKKIFPLNISRDINITGHPVGNGAVVEPNASLDGNDILFSYFPDVFNPANTASMPAGADLYRIKLAPLIQNPNFPVEQLEIVRLTQQPAPADKFKEALNPTLAAATTSNWGGIVNMHPIEIVVDHATSVSPEYGAKKLVFVSNRRRLQSSNGPYGYRHHNFNIYTADIRPDGTIFNINQDHYYTTTSAISPFNLRNGYGFSYLGTTLSDRHWEVQLSNSAGKWRPGQGYARDASNSFHLSTLCPTQLNDTTGQADLLVSTSYYTANNNGFGALVSAPMNLMGVNDNFGNGNIPSQLGENLISTGFSGIEDQPSFYDVGQGRFRGKFSTPRCEGVNTLYAAYAPTAAAGNGSIWQSWCQNRGFPLNNCPYIPGLYDSKIIKRNSLESFDPLQGGFTTVVDDISNSSNGYSYWSLIWPTLMSPIEEKFGNVKPTSSTTWALKTGFPYAKVGTSALWNTDVTDPSCRLGSQFMPGNFLNSTNNNNRVFGNISPLTRIRDFFGNFAIPENNTSCLNPVTPEMVYGIAINLTDNKTDVTRNSEAISLRNESKKLLGVYSIVGQTFNGQPDQSFQAIIPANSPFTFDLLERRTGLKLADVSSWHSLKAGETRNDCGGCHGHAHNLSPVDIEDTLAGQPEYQPANFVDGTPAITYDSTCQPINIVKNSASDATPLWDDGTPLFQGFVTNCGGCHSVGSPTGNNTFAVTPNDAEATFVSLSPYINRGSRKIDLGAVGASAFWAAIGERTDGRPNCPPGLPASDQKYWCFNPNNHRNAFGQPRLCDGSNPTAAAWVYEFGRWMDNHTPRGCDFAGCYTSGGVRTTRVNVAPYANGDRFHPTVSGALVDAEDCSLDQGLNVGYWDDTGVVDSITLTFSDGTASTVTQTAQGGPLLNGLYTFNSSSLSPLQSDDSTVKITVKDATGNQQSYEKTRSQLQYECQVGINTLGDPQPFPPNNGGNEPGSASISMLLPSTLIVGQQATIQISAPASLAGQSVFVLGMYNQSSQSLVLPFGNSTLTLSGYDISNWFFNWSLSNLWAILVDDGNGHATATVSLTLPDDNSLLGSYSFIAVVANGLTTLYGTSGSPRTISSIKDQVKLRADIRDLEKQLKKARTKLSKQKIKKNNLSNTVAHLSSDDSRSTLTKKLRKLRASIKTLKKSTIPALRARIDALKALLV